MLISNIFPFSPLFGFVLLIRRAETAIYELWLYAPFRVLYGGAFALWTDQKNDPPVSVLPLIVCLLLVPLALITKSHAVIMQYLHFVRESPSAQFTQHRRAVLIVPCSLFACCFFVAMTNNGSIAVIGDTASQSQFSPLLATYTTNQFSKLTSSETVHKFQTGCLPCSPFE